MTTFGMVGHYVAASALACSVFAQQRIYLLIAFFFAKLTFGEPRPRNQIARTMRVLPFLGKLRRASADVAPVKTH
jgi:hypothetical protein